MTSKLSHFGYNFQIKIISSLMQNRQFLEQIIDIIDGEYFESDPVKWLVNLCKDYFLEYKRPLTLEVIKFKLKEIDNDILNVSVINTLRDVNKYLNNEDLQFVQDKALDFFKNQALKNAILHSVDILDTTIY